VGRRKVADARGRVLVSPPLQQSWRCWQGRAGEVAPAGCWSLSNRQRWSLLGTIPSTAACLLQRCPHPPQAARPESLPPRRPRRAVPGQTGTPGCLWASLIWGSSARDHGRRHRGEGSCLEALLTLLFGASTPSASFLTRSTILN